MNTLTASLCKKPVIGVTMWLMALCATNQALNEKYVDLGTTGVLLAETTRAPMDEQYRLVFWLWPGDGSQANLRQDWRSLLCASSMPLNISLDIKDGRGVTETHQTFEPSCIRPSLEDQHLLLLGVVPIKKGKFTVEITNNSALSVLKGRRVQVLLMGEGAGYP